MLLCCTGLLLTSIKSFSQKINTAILQKQWPAFWIKVPSGSPGGYGVYLFRKSFELETKPASFTIHVSADNRYKLFVNEKLVSLGPARGDLNHWNYETLDIAPYLHPGKNIVAAQVWNEGEWRPEAQITFQTGFILQGATNTEAVLNTNDTWLCKQDNSYAPLKFNIRTYYVAGAGEIRFMEAQQKSWQAQHFDDRSWQKASKLSNGTPRDILGPFGTPNGWMLVPSEIPPMELKEERLLKMIDIKSGINIPVGFPERKTDVIIPVKSTITILLDQTYLTNAYPTLLFSGGNKATIALSYAEALYSNYPAKGNRNETIGKQFLGRTDSIIADGSSYQQFTTLTYRTYRFVQIRITTDDESLTINDFYGLFTGYPFELKAKAASDDPDLDKILEVGWRTARLCAMETYMDCPYYEQLQYIGDTRIQALVSLYNSGDDRLVKNAINLMDHSRQAEGVTLSRHPSYTPQYIPTFSLWYIGMLNDYSMYGSDLEFVKNKISGTRQILDYFKHYQQSDGSLKNTPQWMFTDWVNNQQGWKDGVGPIGATGESALLDLQLLLAYQTAMDLEIKFGMPPIVKEYQQQIDRLQKTIQKKYWDNNKQLYADREEKDLFSQHTNALAILTGVAGASQLKALTQKLLHDKNLAPASIYFKYYLHLALVKAGLRNDYMKWLDKWRENIQMGMTTWSENSDIDRTRSDCHAWGSSPNIEFYRTVLGIDSDAPGFSKVKITPAPGQLRDIAGSIPHPLGSISVSYKLINNKWKIDVTLPGKLSGTLIWQGKKMILKGGPNKFELDNF